LETIVCGAGAEVLVSGDPHLLGAETGAGGGISTPVYTPSEFLAHIELMRGIRGDN
jgi:predicted nucleic acid-binding protein